MGAIEKLFGRTYNSIGETNADFIIKTRGQVKVQYGNKFIDLIKDGKLNVNDDIIQSVDTVDDIGSTDGIYYVKEDGSVYIVVDGVKVNIVGGVGTTYVSFVGAQDVNGEQRHQAMVNIGFIYATEEAAAASGLSSGVVYVESTGKIYTIENGILKELSLDLPNPYPKQFVVSKSEQTGEGAIVIKGDGKVNSLVVGDSYVYEENGLVLEGENVTIKSGENKVIEVTGDGTKISGDVTFEDHAISEMFMSLNANLNRGFRLYIERGESTLEVDNLIVRKKITGGGSEGTSSSDYYPTYWLREINIVTTVEEDLPPEDEEPSGLWLLDFMFPVKFEVDDLLATCVHTTLTWDEIVEDGGVDEDGNPETEEVSMEADFILYFKVEKIEEETDDDPYRFYVRFLLEELEPEIAEKVDLDGDMLTEWLIRRKVFYVGPGKATTRINANNIDIITINEVKDEKEQKFVTTRIGSINDLNVEIDEDKFNVGTLANKKPGIYSDNLVTIGAKQISSELYKPIFRGGADKDMYPVYEDGFEIPEDDDSKKLVTSEWVNKRIQTVVDNYVTIDTEQTITATKTFTGGIIVNGVLIEAGTTEGLLKLTYGGKTIVLAPDSNSTFDSEVHSSNGFFKE